MTGETGVPKARGGEELRADLLQSLGVPDTGEPGCWPLKSAASCVSDSGKTRAMRSLERARNKFVSKREACENLRCGHHREGLLSKPRKSTRSSEGPWVSCKKGRWWGRAFSLIIQAVLPSP